MKPTCRTVRASFAVCGLLLLTGVRDLTAQGGFSWQEPHAKVLPTGDLEWAPAPFAFEKGAAVRYIDFDGGRDDNDGTAGERAWKHHPWDPAATDRALAHTGAATFVFKRGVVYRGALKVQAAAGTAADPLRLTSDPAWGRGDAAICGAEPVRGWARGGAVGMPDADRVWHAELPFAPRRAWVRGPEGTLRRLALARTPNWTDSNPDDFRAEWWEWENPEWWTDKLKVAVGDRKCHLGIDRKHLTADAETYRDALVWSEYGIVMGSPFASRVESFLPERGALAFQGPWYNDSEKIITGNRYFLEDKPQFLDEEGEFWFEKKGQGGTLYVRLPGDADPNTMVVEAARHSTLLDAGRLESVHISGLVFQGANTYWRLEARPFEDGEIESAGIRLLGSGDGIRIANCRFEHLTGGVRIRADKDADRIGSVAITDCEFLELDRYAVDVSDSSRWGKTDPPFSSVEKVAVLRNHARRVGLRGGRDCHGHTVIVNFADAVEVAGNWIERVGGSGIFVFGGKGSGQLRDKPFSRVLIHHNKVVDPLLISNDWGGIETWQGGPHYLWSNLSVNPGGYWHWSFVNARRQKPEEVSWGAARQGFAYYFDGSFKNYVFNNIAAGKSNETGSPLCNASAFQMCIGFQNTFFNNTAYRFAAAVRRQAPRAGRDKWLGNLFEDMSAWQFLCAEPRDDASANAFQFTDIKGSDYAYGTFAFGANVFHKLPRTFGLFEESGRQYATPAAFAEALQARRAMRSEVGQVSAAPLLAAPERGDFRPTREAAGAGSGVRVFVPWSLSGTVGEWNFCRNNRDPAEVIDEHWYLTAYHRERDEYYRRPTFPLRAAGATADDYENGPLEDWTAGAFRLRGQGEGLVLRHADMARPFELEVEGPAATGWVTATFPERIVPGRKCEVKLTVPAAEAGQKICAHIHWLKSSGWGGFNAWGGHAQPLDSAGPFTFTFTPEDKPDLDAFSLLVFVSPTGEANSSARTANVRIERGTGDGEIALKTVTLGEGKTKGVRTFAGSDLKTPDIYTSNLLIEAFFRTDAGHIGGTIVTKMDEHAGYALTLTSKGEPVFALKSGGAGVTLTGPASINDGQWHHLIAEADRGAGRLRLFVDGKAVAEGRSSLAPGASLHNEADLVVGSSLAGVLDFLRLAQGTLHDARTSIEELYAWEFDGPQHRDFAGLKPGGKRDAGALQRAE